jgi:RHS repeat-associated protein
VTDVTEHDAALNTRSVHVDYDSLHEYPQSIRNGLDQTTIVGYDRATGKLVELRDPNQLPTDWFYDGFGRLAGVIGPDLVATTYDYSAGPADHPIGLETRTEGGERRRTEFDIRGRPATIHSWGASTNAQGKELIEGLVYDADGNLQGHSRPTAANQPATPGMFMAYDNMGRVVTELLPSGRLFDSCYDIDTACKHTPRGYTQCVTHDQRGRPIASADPVLGDCETVLAANTGVSGIRYAYGNFGALSITADQQSNRIDRTNDAWGRPTRIVDPDSGAHDMDYTPFGELKFSQDDVGRRIDFGYDLLGRLIERDDTESGQMRTTTWTWDGGPTLETAQGELLGRITSSASPDGVQETFRYDVATGKLRAQSTTIAGETFDVTYTPDSFGRLQRIDYPASAAASPGLSVIYDYDDYGHVRALRNAAAPAGTQPFWSLSGTDVNGLLTAEVFGNLATTTRTYDPDGRIATIATGVPFGATLQSLTYGYDDNGNVLTRGDGVHARTTTYGYDEFNRLHSDDSAGGRIYDYDDNGNLRSGTFDRPQPHQMSSDGTNSYDYVAGNRVLKSRDGFVERTSYTGFDLPAQIWNEEVANQPHDIVRFAYDADQRRVRKESDAATTIYISGLAERRAPRAGGPATFIYYLGNGERTIGQVSVTGTAAPVVSFVHDDRIGTVHVVSSTDPTTGAVTSTEFDYDAFGLRRNPTWTGAPATNTTGVTLGFTSQESDDEHGLINMGGRIYDPATRHFTSCDPLQNISPGRPSLSPYMYALNNPLSFTDPSGLDDGPVDPDLDGDAGDDVPEIIDPEEIVITEVRDPDLGGVGNDVPVETGDAQPEQEPDSDPWAAVRSGKPVWEAVYTKPRHCHADSETCERAEQMLDVAAGIDDYGKAIALVGEVAVTGEASLVARGITALTMRRVLMSEEALSAAVRVAGRVATRINLAKGATRFTPLRQTGEAVSAGWNHVLAGHFNRAVTNSRSVFSITPSELRALLQSKDVVQAPVMALKNDTFVRTVDVGYTIGTSALKNGGGATTMIKIFTDKAGNLITAFPL